MDLFKNFKKFIIEKYVLDYVTKVTLLGKSATISFTRGALINMNALCLSMIFCALFMVTKLVIFEIVYILLLLIFAVSCYINFVIVKDLPLKLLMKYADFTQIVGIKTSMEKGTSNYFLEPDDAEKFNNLVNISEGLWKEKIDNVKFYRPLLFLMYPLILTPIYITLFVIILL